MPDTTHNTQDPVAEVFKDLLDLPIWVASDWNKAPHDANGRIFSKWSEPDTVLMTYSEARATADKYDLPNVGIIFPATGIVRDGYRLIGIDIDGVDGYHKADPDKGIEAVTFDPIADADSVLARVPLVGQLPATPWEASQSRTGFHGIVWAPESEAASYWGARRAQLAGCDHADTFMAGRRAQHLIITGLLLSGCASIATLDSLEALQAILKPAGDPSAPETLPIPEDGTPHVLTALPWLSMDQRHLVHGTGSIDRSAILHGLLIHLIDKGMSPGDILASLAVNAATAAYLLEHRNQDPVKALDFARYEINRAYEKSLTCARAALTGFNDAWGAAGAVQGAPVALLDAQHLCTDLANARRLQIALGGSVMHAAGCWHVWTGTHWCENRAAAYLRVCDLSRLIRDEADAWRARPTSSSEEKQRNEDIAKALAKWGVKSEMLAALNAAFALLEKVAEVDAERLNANPYLLNVANGTIDLRRGELRPHNMDDLITHLIPIDFDPKAEAPTFRRALLEICGGSQSLAAFLQRWFGYCAIGVTNEQKFAVLYGDGGNGKSLLLETVSEVLGTYASTCAPGLLIAAGKSSRHPAEIADLFGKRLTVAHESGEGAALNEDFIKQATGDDKLKARLMRENFFEWKPTHTLNLLTNHKPQIRGQDNGIWRRVLLIPFTVTFGTAAEVAQGSAHYLRDDHLGEKLKAEYAGILTWLVQGAAAWCMTGLRSPDAVLAAGAEYKSEQDRVGEYLAEHYQCSNAEWVPCDAVYKGYREWALGSGYCPLGKNKFIDAVTKRPGITKALKWIDHGGLGARQKTCFSGLK